MNKEKLKELAETPDSAKETRKKAMISLILVTILIPLSYVGYKAFDALTDKIFY